MQGALDLGSRVKRVGGGYSDVPYDAEELLLLGAEEVLLLREALESARREAQWARRELDEERSQHSLAHRAVLSAARLEAEELRSQLAEMETQLDRSAFSVRVLGEKSEYIDDDGNVRKSGPSNPCPNPRPTPRPRPKP